MRPGQLINVVDLVAISKEEVWLASQKSARTHCAYKQDVAHFMRTLGITSPKQLRLIDHRTVIAWERIMREQEGAAASSIRRLATLSNLFRHLVQYGAASRNPVVDVTRPSINREEDGTAAFSKVEARKLLDTPALDTMTGLRDRAILSVGLQVGLRRAEIAGLTVGNLHQNRGYDALRLTRKGGRRDALAINTQLAARIRAYLEEAGHGAEHDIPLFRPLRETSRAHDPAGRLDPDAIDRLVRKYAAAIRLARSCSTHSMRATFVTTALESGAQLEDVQKAAGYRDLSTTKLYDRRGYNSEKVASFLLPISQLASPFDLCNP